MARQSVFGKSRTRHREVMGNVHSDRHGHGQVCEESKERIVDGVVEEEVVGEFVSGKIERVVYRRSPNVGHDNNDKPRLVAYQPSGSELKGYRENHPVLTCRIKAEQVAHLGMGSQYLLSAGTMRLLGVRPCEITNDLFAHLRVRANQAKGRLKGDGIVRERDVRSQNAQTHRDVIRMAWRESGEKREPSTLGSPTVRIRHMQQAHVSILTKTMRTSHSLRGRGRPKEGLH